MTNITIYGIKNCDTMKKAFDWFNEHQISYRFHDYRTAGISREKIEEWFSRLPVDQVINTRSTTYKELSAARQKSISNKDKAIELIIENPSIVKRPLVETSGNIILGFKPDQWKAILSK